LTRDTSSINLPPIGDLDVDDLASLPEGYRYELHHGNLVILPQVAIAGMFTVRPETINKQLRGIRELLEQAGHTIQPAPDKIATIDDLYHYAVANGVTVPPNIKTAS